MVVEAAAGAGASRVLVVDDEPQITRVLRTILMSQGYQVRTAADGEAALTNFREWSPALVITDLYMPRMNGIELCRRIRALSAIPIIVLSVKGEESTRQAASSFEAGTFRIDLDTRRVHAGGQEIRLTPKEFDLFVYFARHPNRVILHAALLEAVWGEASQDPVEYLRVFMGQLRKKFEQDPSNPRYLLTEPGVGYRLNPDG